MITTINANGFNEPLNACLSPFSPAVLNTNRQLLCSAETPSHPTCPSCTRGGRLDYFIGLQMTTEVGSEAIFLTFTAHRAHAECNRAAFGCTFKAREAHCQQRAI